MAENHLEWYRRLLLKVLSGKAVPLVACRYVALSFRCDFLTGFQIAKAQVVADLEVTLAQKERDLQVNPYGSIASQPVDHASV